jgi:hypothetical protein
VPYADLERRRSILELLGRTWTKLPAAIARAQAWGASWCELSTPFVELAAGSIVAHVGVIELPLMLDGQRVASRASTRSAPRSRSAGAGTCAPR